LSAGRGEVRRKYLNNWQVSHTAGHPSRSLMPPLTPHPWAEPFEDANKQPTSLVAEESLLGGNGWQ